MPTSCVIDGCEGRVVGRGYCRKHYSRWDRYGDPLFLKQPQRTLTEDERFWFWVDKRGPDECWPWTGNVSDKGYGKCRHSVSRMAPRVAFYLANGYVPESTDHECHNRDRDCPGGNSDAHRRCCNPAHLVDRSPAANTAEAHRTRRFCKNGLHEVDDDGTRHGNNRCYECHVAKRQRSNAKQVAKRAGGPGRGRQRVDECPNGHKVADGAFYENARTGQRTCRICKQERERARRAAKRDAA